jgi:phosphohistidine phosphatase
LRIASDPCLFRKITVFFNMKSLYIVRHAKSSWEDSSQSDFERGLNERGKRDAPRMAKRLKEKEIHPDLMLSSPAKRALSTAKRIAEVLNYSKKDIKTDQKLYHADEDTILSVIHTIKDKYNTVVLFGHNPGLTDFVNTIVAEETNIDNVPTCGVVALSLYVESWKDVSWASAKMLFFDYPKAL